MVCWSNFKTSSSSTFFTYTFQRPVFTDLGYLMVSLAMRKYTSRACHIPGIHECICLPCFLFSHQRLHLVTFFRIRIRIGRACVHVQGVRLQFFIALDVLHRLFQNCARASPSSQCANVHSQPCTAIN